MDQSFQRTTGPSASECQMAKAAVDGCLVRFVQELSNLASPLREKITEIGQPFWDFCAKRFGITPTTAQEQP